MAKVVDPLDLAVRVKRRQIGLKDVPEAHRPAVERALQREAPLVARMRDTAPVTDRVSTRVHQRFVAG